MSDETVEMARLKEIAAKLGTTVPKLLALVRAQGPNSRTYTRENVVAVLTNERGETRRIGGAS